MVQGGSEHLLSGINLAILVTDGFELTELTAPRQALEEAGGIVRVVARRRGPVQACEHDQPSSAQVDADLTFSEADPQDFDAVLLPGGLRNAERIRTIPEALQFVQGMHEYGKPVAVIGNGAALLVSAGLVQGRSLTSWPALEKEIRQAGGNWLDQEVVVDGNLISSRHPGDLPALTGTLLEMLAQRVAGSIHGTRDENLNVGLSS